MICPRCTYEQPDSNECISCGVIINKYLAANPSKTGYLGERDDSADVVIPSYIKEVDKKISHSYMWLAFAVITLIIGYASIVLINDAVVKKAIRDDIQQALRTNLKHEFKKKVIVEKILQICKEGKLEGVQTNKILVEFFPDKEPVRNNSINYTVSVTVPYITNIFSIHRKTDIIVRVDSAYPIDKSIIELRLRALLNID